MSRAAEIARERAERMADAEAAYKRGEITRDALTQRLLEAVRWAENERAETRRAA